jgi:ABC-type Fe3+ transport system substrate-binding protein
VKDVDNRVIVGAVIVIVCVGAIGFIMMNQQQPPVEDGNGGNGGTEPNETPTKATVKGAVLDSSGNPIQGATVKIGSLSATTNAQGTYSFELDKGDYVIEASKDGYSQGVKTVSVTEYKDYDADFSLKVVSSGGAEGKTLRIITRHGADILFDAESAFLETDFAKEHNIVNIEWLPVGEELWVQTISRSGDIDAAWGGGPTLFDTVMNEGLLAPLDDSGLSAIFDDIPYELSGAMTRRVVDNRIYWSGAAISSFGFTINKQYLANKGLPEPTTWDDLASPVYAVTLPQPSVGTADPTQSTSNTRMFHIILQIYGWQDGWDLLIRMGANSNIYGQSELVRDAAINGIVGVGTTIDFYGYTAQIMNPELCRYIFPEDGTIVNADPIALLTTAEYPEEALGFIRWCLTDGQKVWLNPNINRLPVNPAVFDTPEGIERADLKDVYEKTKIALTIVFSEEEASSYQSAMQQFFHAVIVRQQLKLEKVWEDLTLSLEEGRITRAQFDDLAGKLGDPHLFEFTDPITGEAKTFTMEYAQSINDRIKVDAEYKDLLVDAWIDSADAHYSDIEAELNSIS